VFRNSGWKNGIVFKKVIGKFGPKNLTLRSLQTQDQVSANGR